MLFPNSSAVHLASLPLRTLIARPARPPLRFIFIEARIGTARSKSNLQPDWHESKPVG